MESGVLVNKYILQPRLPGPTTGSHWQRHFLEVKVLQADTYLPGIVHLETSQFKAHPRGRMFFPMAEAS